MYGWTDGISPHYTGLCPLSGPLHKKDGDGGGDNDIDDNVDNNYDNDNNDVDGEGSSCVRMMDLGPKQAEIN